MLDDTEIDARWRDGMRVLGAHLGATAAPGAAARVSARVEARSRHRAIRRTATSLVTLAAIIAVVATLAVGHNTSTHVRTRPGQSPTPQLSDEGVPIRAQLRLTAPRPVLTLIASIDSPQAAGVTIHGKVIRLAHPGLYRFVVDGAPGHSIGFTELPARDRITIGRPGRDALTVDLAPGTYVIDCNVPGHALAGMLLHVIVG